MSDSIADALRKALGMQPATKIGGMVGNAAQALGGRGYQLAVQEAKATGMPVPTPEQYAASQKQ
jgi:hypothetical protein